MATIQIIVGTVNGRAWQSAHAVARVLNHQGHQVRVNDEPQVADLRGDGDEVLLVCCSTTGQGELPPMLHPLFHALDAGAVPLDERRYGVIALGDSGYQYFAQAGYLMEDALYQAGGRRVGEMCVLDARRVANQPLAAAQWANDWVEQLAG